MLHPETLQFYSDLSLNNYKEWFHANRPRYDIAKADYLQLATTLLEEMQKVDPTLANLQPKQCIFRINRDIRFSKDKTPYKSHLGIGLSNNKNMSENAGYYLHIDPMGSFLAGGIHMPPSDTMKKIRKEIATFHEDLEAIFDHPEFKSRFNGFDTDERLKLKRPPQGYSADDKAIEFLKYKSFTVSKPFDISLVTDPKGVNFVLEHFKILKPLNDFLNRSFYE